jgi:hypothetical protein
MTNYPVPNKAHFLRPARRRATWQAWLFGAAFVAGWLIADALDVWALKHEPKPSQNLVIERITTRQGECK